MTGFSWVLTWLSHHLHDITFRGHNFYRAPMFSPRKQATMHVHTDSFQLIKRQCSCSMHGDQTTPTLNSNVTFLSLIKLFHVCKAYAAISVSSLLMIEIALRIFMGNNISYQSMMALSIFKIQIVFSIVIRCSLQAKGFLNPIEF